MYIKMYFKDARFPSGVVFSARARRTILHFLFARMKLCGLS